MANKFEVICSILLLKLARLTRRIQHIRRRTEYVPCDSVPMESSLRPETVQETSGEAHYFGI